MERKMRMDNTILNCSNVTKNYGSIPALVDLSLYVPRGKIIGLLGPNGSGKTTFIKLAAGLLTPTYGHITINGEPPGVKSKSAVSYLPERTYFSPWMRVNDVLDLFADFYEDFDKLKAFDMLRRLSIEPGSKIKTLSKGTKEKVQLVLVMARRAQLYLLDEPIGGVDPATRDYILDTIISNYRSDATIIISTHLIYDIEKILDDFLFINGGRIHMHGAAEAVRKEHGKSIDELFREVFRC